LIDGGTEVLATMLLI